MSTVKEFENYIELKNFEKFGLKIIFTKKSYGNILKKSRAEIKKDFFLNKEIISSHQTHSSNVTLIENLNNTYFEDNDGFVTDRNDVAFLTKYADCLPVFIYDESSTFFGVVHSGWQGSFKEITKNAIEKIFTKTGNRDYSKINILFGIGISCKNYEVGEEFYLKFKEKFSKEIVEKAFKKATNKIFFDNQLFNYLLFQEYGIDKNKIFTNSLCTFDGDSFHSHRRDKENSGRNGAIIYKN